MQNNDSNNFLDEDDIDLKEILKLLINSKKLIITITLIITTLGAIYSFQKATEYKSTALIEIGSYDQDKKILIETSAILTEELNIKFSHKQEELVINSNNLSIQPIDDVLARLIQISYTSTSSATSEKIVNEIVRYINNRHSLLLINNTQKNEKQLTNEIEKLNTQIEFSKNAILNQNESSKLRISNEIEKLNNSLPSIDSKINALNKVIIEDEAEGDNLKILALIDYENLKLKLSQEKDHLETELKLLQSKDLESISLESNFIFTLSQEKDVLEFELESLMKQNPTSSQLIGEIVTNAIDSKKEFIIFLSFVFGLSLSIVIVFINNFLKAFKEE